jgi:hypothetical protein
VSGGNSGRSHLLAYRGAARFCEVLESLSAIRGVFEKYEMLVFA